MSEGFYIRETLDQRDVDQIYEVYDTLFTARLHHGGNFTHRPGRQYIEENPGIPVQAVREQFQRKFELNISKMKAYIAKIKAKRQVQGDYKTQYTLLRSYVEELCNTNPGSTVHIEVEPGRNPDDTTRVFKKIYVCLGGLKQGFKAIGRHMLGLDGAFMKGQYPGQVLSAVGADPNNNIYPVAYAIVEAENLSSWTWFLQCLGDDLDLGSNSHFTFISDRQKGLMAAIQKLFPLAEHRFCLKHIHENMKLSYKGKLYKDKLWKAAKCTTIVQFEEAMEELKAFNKNAHAWLSKIPPQHWTLSHFSGRAVSNMLMNNTCESFNSKIIDARDKPIISALEYIREYLMRRIVTILMVQQRTEGLLSPYAQQTLEEIKKKATRYSVQWNGDDQYQVSRKSQCVVHMDRKWCTCRAWEISGIPCRHAVATIWFMATNGKQVRCLESWVNPLYRLDNWKKVYSFKVNPISGRSMWPKSMVPTTLKPPKHKK
ncbi:putative Zinc finger, SWIM-type, MULE transposase domain-containing protein [Helianthus annuus]|nr:putative Zinc finger, SWIM-type, MULE transposase domain-containing protein [Helianthus annuus]